MKIEKIRDNLQWPALASALIFVLTTLWRRSDFPVHTHWLGMLLLRASFFSTPLLALVTIPRWQSFVAIAALIYGIFVAVAA